MPIYVYKHPDKEEYIEVIQGMNDEHSYEQDGLAWERVFLAPNASIDADADPFNSICNKPSKKRIYISGRAITKL